jgi:hypothetical protein
MFQQTGYLNGMGKIQAITVLMPLICTVLASEATNTNIAYITFYMMISTDINDLLSTKFKDDAEIDRLYQRIVETVIIHEGLYPIQESMITWHQLIDLPLHIKKVGPLKGSWEFYGERSLSLLKKEVPDGGDSFDKTVMRSYSALEEIKLQNNYNFTLEDFVNKDRHVDDDINDVNNFSVKFDRLQYSDEKFLLSNLINASNSDNSEMKFNQYELEMLLKLLINEVKKQTKNKYEAYFNSPLYRMFTAYTFHNNNTKFVTFLQCCVDKSSEMFKNYCIPKKDSFYYIQCTEFGYYQSIEEQYFFVEDLESIEAILFRFCPHRFENCLVYGIRMDSRGLLCAENTASVNNAPTNLLNQLKSNWFIGKGLSSWFKYRYDENSALDDDQAFGFKFYTKYCYGQFNYFFRAYLPDEPFLHGIPLASAVCRFSEVDQYMDTVIVSTHEESFVLDQPFVSLTNVYSTKILVGGRDCLKFPFKLKKKYGQMSGTMNRMYSGKNPSEVDDLYFLDLEPFRKTIKFDILNYNYHKFEYKNQYYK